MSSAILCSLAELGTGSARSSQILTQPQSMNNRLAAYLFSSLTAAFAFSILSPEVELWRPITAGFVLCTSIIGLIVANED